jgi:hypothetical protein
MNTQELELFRSMLEMVGSVGETSVWLVVLWWSIGLIKGAALLGFFGWLAYYALSTLVSANRDIEMLRKWQAIVKDSKSTHSYTSNPEANLLLEELIRRTY